MKIKRFFAHSPLYLTPHNAFLMLQYGVPAKVASERLGHSSIGITMDLYSHVVSDMQKDAAEKINCGIFQKLSSDSQPRVI